jgi:hypothetical protein
MNYKLKDLQKLVQAMSGAEKRHFTLLSSAFFASKKDISEIALKEYTGVDTSIKNQLFKNVRKSLRTFHQEQSVEIRIHNYLSDIEILYDLNLPNQSLYLLKKAYKDAVAYEKFRLLLLILEWERKLNIVLDKPVKSIKAIAEEEQEVLRKLMQIVQLENIYSKAQERSHIEGAENNNLRALRLSKGNVLF